ncbi:unnamed protein product [Heterobilharzia americana]|nr:unnamed protein product [Heterobilharzia americana]
MTHRGHEGDPKFRYAKHSGKDISLICPNLSVTSKSDNVSHSIDSLLDGVTSEMSVRRYVDGLKHVCKNQDYSEKGSPMSPSCEVKIKDAEIISSLVRKNETLLRENRDCKSQIRKQAIQIQLLENKLKILCSNELERNIQTTGTTRKTDILEKCCEKLQKKIFEMEEFLHDHGLMWVGTESNDDGNITNTDRKHEIKFDEAIFNSLIQQIQSLNNWIAQGNERKIIPQSNSSNIVCFRNESPVPIILYADGLCLHSGPFRSYKNHETLQFVQDILDGYFPSELQSRYPNGVQFELIDKHTIQYMSLRKPSSFLSHGNKLGSFYSSATDESNTDNEVSSYERYKSSNDENEIFNIERVDNQTDEEMNNLFSEIIPHTLNDKRSQLLTFDDLLKRLPACKLTKSGQILNIRQDIQNEFGRQVSIPITKNIEVNHATETPYIDNDEIKSNKFITLRIYSENGSEIYNLKMDSRSTVQQLYSILDQVRSKHSSVNNRNYRLVTMCIRNSTNNSNELYYRQSLVDQSATLEESGIVDRTTLRMESLRQKLTENPSHFDTNSLLSTKGNALWDCTESVMPNHLFSESLNKPIKPPELN